MNIQRKIEEIRRKPEHIRIRYVWFLTAFCMFFVLLIWEISIKTDPRLIQKKSDSKFNFKENNVIKDIQEKSEDIKKIKDNLSEITEKKGVSSEEMNNPEKVEIKNELTR